MTKLQEKLCKYIDFEVRKIINAYVKISIYSNNLMMKITII